MNRKRFGSIPAFFLTLAMLAPLGHSLQALAEDEDEAQIATIDYIVPEENYYVIGDIPYRLGRHARVTDAEGHRIGRGRLRTGTSVIIEAWHAEETDSGIENIIDAVRLAGD